MDTARFLIAVAAVAVHLILALLFVGCVIGLIMVAAR